MITTREFLGIEKTHLSTWRLPVVDRITGGRSGSLFGGVGLAAGILALESATNRPPIWATGQYVSRLAPPSSSISMSHPWQSDTSSRRAASAAFPVTARS